jgi:hypothetical protein
VNTGDAGMAGTVVFASLKYSEVRFYPLFVLFSMNFTDINYFAMIWS